MAQRQSQQYWTREAIESIKASFRQQATAPKPKPKPKPVKYPATILEGGCLLHRLPTCQAAPIAIR